MDSAISNNEKNNNVGLSGQNEFEKLWKTVQDNPSDFNAFSQLVALAEKDGDIEKIRKAYEAFLDEYPLCYAFWKKYAEHEAAKKEFTKAKAIYQQALSDKGIPYSVDMWTCYCSFLIDTPAARENLEEIRRTFENAVQHVGLDYTSHSLWDKFIDWEQSQSAWKNVMSLYHRVLAIPLEKASSYFERYKKFVTSHKLADLLTPEEETQLFQSQKFADEMQQKTKLIAIKEEIHKKVLEECKKRSNYEAEIQKRPYFHVKPLDDTLLETWRKYLEMEEAEGNHERIIQLFERCLIPCCNYHEFWLRYTTYLEKREAWDSLRTVFQRGTRLLKRRPELYLEFAAFEEEHNNHDRAENLFQTVMKMIPNHVESIMRYINFKRRQKDYETCCRLYEEAITKAKSPLTVAFLSMHYARFLEKTRNDPKKAREVYSSAIQRAGSIKHLWIAFINFEIAQNDENMEERVVALYTKALEASEGEQKLSLEDRKDILLSFVEFANDTGSDIRRFRQLTKEYRQMVKVAPSRKRPLEQPENEEETNKPTKVPRTGESPTVTAASASQPVVMPPTSPYYGQYAMPSYYGYNYPYMHGYPGYGSLPGYPPHSPPTPYGGS